MHKAPRFRVKDALLATFWLCICAASASKLRASSGNTDPMLQAVLLFLAVLTPCIALGSLFRCLRLGLVIGALVAFAALVFAFTPRSHESAGEIFNAGSSGHDGKRL